MEQMFGLGCGLIVIACNTASAVALRWLQQRWLPAQERWRDRNILGIIVPTIEAATSRPWLDDMVVAQVCCRFKRGTDAPEHIWVQWFFAWAACSILTQLDQFR